MGYNERRGSHVSEFITNLNAIPSTQETASQEQGNFNLDDDQPLFTNTDFLDFVDLDDFDFDIGQEADLQPANFDSNCPSPVAGDVDATNKGLNFIQDVMAPAEDFAFPDFRSFPPQYLFTAEELPTSPLHHTSDSIYATSSVSSPQSGLISPRSGKKPKFNVIIENPYTPGFEDTSRVAAAEDKRCRNTAASARFRVNKKHRQQALGKSVKEMNEKLSALEGQMNQLETENLWLKNLILKKNENKDDIAALWKKYSQENAEREISECKDGVGTGKE